MKLIKVRDNQNRPVNGLDIMMSAVFGDHVPREFIPGEHYRTGEHVYYIDKFGNLKIWSCNISGTYLRCEDPSFSEWSLNSVIQKNANVANIYFDKSKESEMYEMKSVVSPVNNYEEYEGHAKFNAVFDDFDFNDYLNPGDMVEVYIRREHSDRYLTPDEYKFDGKNLLVDMPLADIEDVLNESSLYTPEGASVPDSVDPPFWYGENNERKTFNINTPGINLINYDILGHFGLSIEYGYKLSDLRIESVHTLVKSDAFDDQSKKVYRFDEISVDGNHDRISNEINKDVQLVSIPIVVEKSRGITDTLILTYNKNTQLIDIGCANGYIKQIKFSLVAKKYKPLSIFMIGSKAKSDMSRYIRMINEFGTVVEFEDEHYIKFPCMDLLKYNSYEFELYYDGVYRNDYEEYIDDKGDLYIKLLNKDGINWDSDTFLFHIFYCISQGAAIIKTTDTQKVTTEKEAFRIFLTTEYINKYQWIKLREDSKLIPPEYIIGSKGIATITDENHYLNIGQILKSDVFSLIFNNIERRLGSSTVSCNSEAYPIMEQTRELVIPFIDYDSEKDDFLIFKSGGVLISSAKWYLNNECVNLYSHESPLHRGDYVDFRLLDRDDTVRIYNKYLTGTSKAQEAMDIGVDINNVAFFLLFTTSGQFISPSKYTITGSTITFNKNCNQPFVVDNGTRLEAVYGVYKSDSSKTLYTTLQLKATVDNQKEFFLDEDLDYNPSADNILIFREDGMYIGERFYRIDEPTNKIIIDNGSSVPKGSHIDVVIIRNLSLDIAVSNV